MKKNAILKNANQISKSDTNWKIAIDIFLRKTVVEYPEPMKWWAYILNITKGDFNQLLDGYTGDIVKIHKQLSSNL
jgi:hypothetical protein